MRPHEHLDDAALLQEYHEAKSYADELYARLSDIKAEFAARFKETGQKVFESDLATMRFDSEKVSLAWLEREYGFTKEEIPADVMTEKVTLALDTDKVKAWLEGQGMELRQSYTPVFKLKPMKV